ncbi:MAG: nitrate- and nitrite sensing domain-containing protein [Sulfurimonadaceae bacterium]
MKKLILILLIAVSPMMAFTLFDDKGTDKEYLHLVSSIKDVAISTQKTRGLTNSFMNGNVAAQLLVYAQREQMMKDFEEIKRLSSKSKLPENYSKESAALMKKLKKLNRKAFKKNPAEVFASYTSVIEQWIALNGKIIDSHFKAGDGDTYMAVSMLNNTLLPLTENIGKLRGMGSGIVARGTCNDIETPKMRSFATNIEQYRNQMKTYLDKHSYKSLSKSDLDAVNAKIAAYAKLTEENVIGKEEIHLDANKFFDQGTACIGGVLKVYNAVSGDIESKL